MSTKNGEMENAWAAIRRLAEENRLRAEERAEEDRRRAAERAQEDRRRAEENRRRDARMDRLEAEGDRVLGSVGRLAEGMVEPALPRLAARFGVRIRKTAHRTKSHLNGRTIEVDVLGTGVDRSGAPVAVLLEAAAHLTTQKVEQALKALRDFRAFFPEYRDYVLLAGVAGMQVEENAREWAQREGLMVLGPAGDTVRLLNRRGFRPRLFAPNGRSR